MEILNFGILFLEYPNHSVVPATRLGERDASIQMAGKRKVSIICNPLLLSS